MRAGEGRLGAHGEIPREQYAIAGDPDHRVPAGVIGAHGGELGVDAAEIDVVGVFEGDVGLAEVCILEELGTDRGAFGKDVRKVQEPPPGSRAQGRRWRQSDDERQFTPISLARLGFSQLASLSRI